MATVYVRDPRPYIYRAYSESNDSLLFRAGALPNEDRRKLPTVHLPRPIPTGIFSPRFSAREPVTSGALRHRSRRAILENRVGLLSDPPALLRKR